MTRSVLTTVVFASWALVAVDLRARQHWAYRAPVRPTPPLVDGRRAPPIDAFVRRRLEAEGLSASPSASRPELIRRLCLDLGGLPPTASEVESFVTDDSPDAYEKIVDRLLASPRFGERWAQPWLDLARYADSNGFQADQIRESWPYRDWVVAALATDMPFDRFSIEQLAGDLLPDATPGQRVATGFHRTVPCNVEAGVHPEANRTDQLLDRVNTTGTVWLGVTLECAQCHDHKYDPFTMVDYYRLFAYFNNTPLEVRNASGKGVQFDFWGPKLSLPLAPLLAERKKRLEQAARELRGRRTKLLADTAVRDKWEKEVASRDDLPEPVAKALRKTAVKRSKKERRVVAAHFAKRHRPLRDLDAEIAGRRKELAAIRPPSTLVMVEMEQPRETHVLARGSYLEKGERVETGTPAALPPLPADSPPNRLGLARWLVDGSNPLVARVTVNRWWAELFGRGIVATLEDFGSRGDRPTHPEVLDWLAVDLVESGWSMKRLLRQIVSSGTYRQSSRIRPEMIERDPRNELLARASRFRMSAEMIRDNALAVSGLLSARIGGSPVMPYQPPGIWRHVGRGGPTWTEAKDESRYRRGIYIVHRRAAPYPSLVNFDAPDRGACTVARARTNTPLQALTLLNDPAYVEAALALAVRILQESASSADEERVRHAFLLVLGRWPTDGESATVSRLVAERAHRLSSDSKAVKQLLDVGGVFRPPGNLIRSEVATWFYVASVLLNLDETITRE